MTQPYTHLPRLAWDGALAFVAVIEAGQDDWLRETLTEQLGEVYGQHVIKSHIRLHARPENADTERGLWRAVLQGTPAELTETLADVVVAARARL